MLLDLGENICHLPICKAMLVNCQTDQRSGNDYLNVSSQYHEVFSPLEITVFKMLHITAFYYSIGCISMEQNHIPKLEFRNTCFKLKKQSSLWKPGAKQIINLRGTCTTADVPRDMWQIQFQQTQQAFLPFTIWQCLICL